ncbi:MAG: AmmeMemoRadiSam system protein B [Desulfarculaceae bacterium]|nr:AmmeMemoRadiSam system protein B [Desulfarculaceae bacterium]
MKRKRASFKGAWYPASAGECETSIKAFLKEKGGSLKGRFPGGIVPHAGWVFSGSIACRVIASLDSNVDAVVMFGVHMRPDSKPFILSGGSWETPFGDLEVHEKLAEHISRKEKIHKMTPGSFPDENTIELQLPFVKYFFNDAPIVAAGVPPSDTAERIGEAACDAAQDLGLTIAVIGSTDMTHYGAAFGFSPAGTGEKAYKWVKEENDRAGIEALMAMDPGRIVKEGLVSQNMCCAGAAAAATAAAKKTGAARAVEVDYGSSFEKSPGDSFVGYSGVLFSLD